MTEQDKMDRRMIQRLRQEIEIGSHEHDKLVDALAAQGERLDKMRETARLLWEQTGRYVNMAAVVEKQHSVEGAAS